MTRISRLELKKLGPGQAALLRLDAKTGCPVDDAGNYIKSGEERYLKFDSEAGARLYAGGRLEVEPLSEWLVMDATGGRLALLNNEKAWAGEIARHTKKEKH